MVGSVSIWTREATLATFLVTVSMKFELSRGTYMTHHFKVLMTNINVPLWIIYQGYEKSLTHWLEEGYLATNMNNNLTTKKKIFYYNFFFWVNYFFFQWLDNLLPRLNTSKLTSIVAGLRFYLGTSTLYYIYLIFTKMYLEHSHQFF